MCVRVCSYPATASDSLSVPASESTAGSFMICMYVWMHVCMYVCMYGCMYVCMYVCMHVCMYASMYVCMYLCMYVCMYGCMYVLVRRSVGYRSRNRWFAGEIQAPLGALCRRIRRGRRRGRVPHTIPGCSTGGFNIDFHRLQFHDHLMRSLDHKKGDVPVEHFVEVHQPTPHRTSFEK